jgi:hypothetical protein
LPAKRGTIYKSGACVGAEIVVVFAASCPAFDAGTFLKCIQKMRGLRGVENAFVCSLGEKQGVELALRKEELEDEEGRSRATSNRNNSLRKWQSA